MADFAFHHCRQTEEKQACELTSKVGLRERRPRDKVALTRQKDRPVQRERHLRLEWQLTNVKCSAEPRTAPTDRLSEIPLHGREHPGLEVRQPTQDQHANKSRAGTDTRVAEPWVSATPPSTKARSTSEARDDTETYGKNVPRGKEKAASNTTGKSSKRGNERAANIGTTRRHLVTSADVRVEWWGRARLWSPPE